MRGRFHQAALVGDRDKLGAITGVQSGHRALDAAAYGQRAQDELIGDLGVGLAVRGRLFTVSGDDARPVSSGRSAGREAQPAPEARALTPQAGAW
jgi:hypothetical protein